MTHVKRSGTECGTATKEARRKNIGKIKLIFVNMQLIILTMVIKSTNSVLIYISFDRARRDESSDTNYTSPGIYAEKLVKKHSL